MAYGIEVYGDGMLTLSPSMRLARFVDFFIVDTFEGSRTIPGLGSSGFFYVEAQGGLTGGNQWSKKQPSMTSQYFERHGDTLSWTYSFNSEWSPTRDDDTPPIYYVTVLLYR